MFFLRMFKLQWKTKPLSVAIVTNHSFLPSQNSSSTKRKVFNTSPFGARRVEIPGNPDVGAVIGGADRCIPWFAQNARKKPRFLSSQPGKSLFIAETVSPNTGMKPRNN